MGQEPTDWRDWSPEQIELRHKIHDKYVRTDPVVRDIHRLYTVLDGKSSALFTHVSLMIAACTFMAGSPTDGKDVIPLLEKLAFLVLTVCYLAIAIRLLGVLDFNMYRSRRAILDKEAFFQQHHDNEYAPEVDETNGPMRTFFAEAVQSRGKAHSDSLAWTGRLTKAAIALIAADALLRLASSEPLTLLLAKAHALL